MNGSRIYPQNLDIDCNSPNVGLAFTLYKQAFLDLRRRYAKTLLWLIPSCIAFFFVVIKLELLGRTLLACAALTTYLGMAIRPSYAYQVSENRRVARYYLWHEFRFKNVLGHLRGIVDTATESFFGLIKVLIGLLFTPFVVGFSVLYFTYRFLNWTIWLHHFKLVGHVLEEASQRQTVPDGGNTVLPSVMTSGSAPPADPDGQEHSNTGTAGSSPSTPDTGSSNQEAETVEFEVPSGAKSRVLSILAKLVSIAAATAGKASKSGKPMVVKASENIREARPAGGGERRQEHSGDPSNDAKSALPGDSSDNTGHPEASGKATEKQSIHYTDLWNIRGAKRKHKFEGPVLLTADRAIFGFTQGGNRRADSDDASSGSIESPLSDWIDAGSTSIPAEVTVVRLPNDTPQASALGRLFSEHREDQVNRAVVLPRKLVRRAYLSGRTLSRFVNFEIEGSDLVLDAYVIDSKKKLQAMFQGLGWSLDLKK
jgi:hypothetical protein